MSWTVAFEIGNGRLPALDRDLILLETGGHGADVHLEVGGEELGVGGDAALRQALLEDPSGGGLVAFAGASAARSAPERRRARR
jgi:hypothetical protein